MARKRKASMTALEAQVLEYDTANSGPDLNVTSPSSSTSATHSSLRRSSRTNKPAAQEIPTKGAGVRPVEPELPQEVGAGSSSDWDLSPAEINKSKAMAAKGVEAAIHRLERMERRLKRDVKRQKLKLEESVVTVTKQAEEAQSSMPMEPSSVRTSLPAGEPRLLTHEQEKVESGGDYEDFHGYRGEGLLSEGESVPDEHKKESDDAIQAVERGAGRPPPVNSDYLPLPWKGRLGYACLNTYLRAAKPPVFCSRTCRLASILDHRHPLQDPAMPEHHTKNKPDKTKKGEVEVGLKWVQEIGLTNARDIPKMLRWNDKYGIKFMRLSSEMFPFASHEEYGYKLATFASKVLAEAGTVAAELGHRLTTHPGQFTQLGSPRQEVVTASVRDLEYHDEMLSLLRLPPQQDRDAVMILHMGGMFGDKAATLNRFRKNYTSLLSPSIKARLVLENDDMGWSVHDLLPICEELNIPLVLDYHHHNIVFDASKVREGTLDISAPELMDRITATWRRKRITQKMHYSEPRPGAVTPRERRGHSARVSTLPPCPPTMDLMIEAKDKEQAVFELMRNFRLPGHERIHDIIPHEREDESRLAKKPKAPALLSRKRRGKIESRGEDGVETKDGIEPKIGGGKSGDQSQAQERREQESEAVHVSPEAFGMGGPLNRVYWPPGMEDWLKPRKRELKRKLQEAAEVEVQDDRDEG